MREQVRVDAGLDGAVFPVFAKAAIGNEAPHNISSTAAIAAVEAGFMTPPFRRDTDASIRVGYFESGRSGTAAGGSLLFKVNSLDTNVMPSASTMASGLNCLRSLSSISLSQRLSRISQSLS